MSLDREEKERISQYTGIILSLAVLTIIAVAWGVL